MVAMIYRRTSYREGLGTKTGLLVERCRQEAAGMLNRPQCHTPRDASVRGKTADSALRALRTPTSGPLTCWQRGPYSHAAWPHCLCHLLSRHEAVVVKVVKVVKVAAVIVVAVAVAVAEAAATARTEEEAVGNYLRVVSFSCAG